jgi:signal peptidase
VTGAIGRHAVTVVPVRRQLRSGTRLLRRICAATVVLIVLAAAVSGLLLHLSLSPVLTGSMRPASRPGDALLTRLVDVRTVHAGQIVVFVPPGENAAYAHRVTSVSGDRAHPTVTTQGDANPAPDPWHASLPGPQVRMVVASVPALGNLLVRLHGPGMRAALVAVLGLIVTTLGVRSILRRPAPTPRITRSASAQPTL